jgi:hypothetical protein
MVFRKRVFIFQNPAGFFPPRMDWWFDSFQTESFNRRFPAFSQRGGCRHNRPVCAGFQESFEAGGVSIWLGERPREPELN